VVIFCGLIVAAFTSFTVEWSLFTTNVTMTTLVAVKVAFLFSFVIIQTASLAVVLSEVLFAFDACFSLRLRRVTSQTLNSFYQETIHHVLNFNVHFVVIHLFVVTNSAWVKIIRRTTIIRAFHKACSFVVLTPKLDRFRFVKLYFSTRYSFSFFFNHLRY
jgi:hypothetical protein